TALWGGIITGRAAGGCPAPNALPPWPTLPDAGAARDSLVQITENWLGGVPRRTGCPGRGGEPPATLSRLDRPGSVLGFCVTAVPAKRLLRAGHAGEVPRITHVASYPRWRPTVLPSEAMGNVARTRTAGWERSHCSMAWLRAKGERQRIGRGRV